MEIDDFILNVYIIKIPSEDFSGAGSININNAVKRVLNIKDAIKFFVVALFSIEI